MSGESQVTNQEIDRRYRGFITNRLLSVDLPIIEDDYEEKLGRNDLVSREHIGGELEYLGMKVDELLGRILDIGVGGGRSLDQAIQNGFDMIAVEIALQATVGRLHPGGRSMLRESIARENLEKVKAKYPDRLWEIDATTGIPVEDDYFNTVIACISLPPYARNPREVVTSVLEMVRVSRGHVAFHAGYPTIPRGEMLASYGVGRTQFDFPLDSFLKELNMFGVGMEWREVKDSSEFARGNIVSAHLNTSGKNQENLTECRDYLFAEYGG